MAALAALMALLALALGTASCGDDDGDDDRGAAANAQSQSQDEVDPASFDDSPEGRIRALHAKFIDAFYDKDVESVCDLTTRKGQRLWAKGDKSCEDGLRTFYDSVSSLGKNRPRVLKVRIDGQRALAMTQVKGNDVYPVQFREESGEWKMDAGGGL